MSRWFTIGLVFLAHSCDIGHETGPTDSVSTSDSLSVPDTDTASGSADTEDTDHRPSCEQAAKRLGKPVCVHEVPDLETWELVSIPTGLPGQLGVTKHLVPANETAPLPTLFMVASAYRYHYEFMAAAFPEDYTGLSPDEYLAMLFDPQERMYYAGTVTAYLGDTDVVYGFTVWDDQKGAASVVTYEMVLAVYDALSPAFLVGELQFVPMGPFQAEAAQEWDAAFPIYWEAL